MFPNARPTVYRGIAMRSRLEASYAAMFDEFEVDWTYEPRCYADGLEQYLPDFEIDAGGGQSIFVEVKGVCDFEREARRMEVILGSDSEAALAICVGDPWTYPGQAWNRWHRISPGVCTGDWLQTRDIWAATVGLSKAIRKWLERECASA